MSNTFFHVCMMNVIVKYEGAVYVKYLWNTLCIDVQQLERISQLPCSVADHPLSVHSP